MANFTPEDLEPATEFHAFKRAYPGALRCAECNLPRPAAPHILPKQHKLHPDLHPAFEIRRGGLTREQWAHWFMCEPKTLNHLPNFNELLDAAFEEK